MSRPLSPPAAFDALVTDRLTTTASYPYLRLRLDEELERARRYGRPLSLVLVDLDDLRGVNDRYGRGAGDTALREVAALLLGGARSVDRVGRWAGGAFAIVLPETGSGAAYGIAERLRADIAARRFQVVTTGGRRRVQIRVTVCCGVATLGKDGRSLTARADEALFRAKLGGRNRSVTDA